MRAQRQTRVELGDRGGEHHGIRTAQRQMELHGTRLPRPAGRLAESRPLLSPLRRLVVATAEVRTHERRDARRDLLVRSERQRVPLPGKRQTQCRDGRHRAAIAATSAAVSVSVDPRYSPSSKGMRSR